jgi:hypothetical protein
MIRSARQRAADDEILEEAFGLSQMTVDTAGVVPGGEHLPEHPSTEGMNIYAVRKGQCRWPLKTPGMVCGKQCEDKRSEFCEQCKQILQSRIVAYRHALELHLFVFRRVHIRTGLTTSNRKSPRCEVAVDKELDGVTIGRTGGRWRPVT